MLISSLKEGKMRYLYLLRHANALAGRLDKERALDHSGIEQARSVGLHLNQYPKIELIKTSDSKRTIQTYEHLLKTLNYKPNEIVKSSNLYNANADNIIAEIENTDSEINSLLLIAHNPGIMLVTQKLNLEVPSNLMTKFLESQSPAKLVIIQSESYYWENLTKFNNKILDIFWPK